MPDGYIYVYYQMKYIVIIIFYLLLSLNLKATIIFIPEFYSKSCKIIVRGYGSYINYTALLYYLDEFNRQFFNDSAYIIVDFDDDYNYSDSFNKYPLNYQINYLSSPVNFSCNGSPWKNPAVFLNVSTRNISHRDIFKLLYFALKKGRDHPNKFGENDISTILTLDIYPDFSKILKYRFYNTFFSVETENDYIDYFIQNDSFYLYYNERHTPKRISDYMDLVSPFNSKSNEKALASFEHIDFMTSNDNESSLVVINDTTFYIYDLPKESLYGPYVMLSPHPYIRQYNVPEIRQRFQKVNDSVFKVYGGVFGGEIYSVHVNVETNNITLDSSEYYPRLKEYINEYVQTSDSLDREILTTFFLEKKERNQKQITAIVGVIIIAINTLLLLFFARRSMR